MTVAEVEAARQSAMEFSARANDLSRRALPDPAVTALFNRLMVEAKVRCLNWVESLEYVIQKRRSILN